MQPRGELGSGVTAGGAVSAVTGTTGFGAGAILPCSSSGGGVSGSTSVHALANFGARPGGDSDESVPHNPPVRRAV